MHMAGYKRDMVGTSWKQLLQVGLLFRVENFFATCFCCFFLGMVRKREERWEGRPRGRCMVCKI